MMKHNIVILARLVALLSFIILSCIVHYGLFYSKDKTYVEILTENMYIYFVYFLFSLLLGEHLLNFLKRRK